MFPRKALWYALACALFILLVGVVLIGCSDKSGGSTTIDSAFFPLTAFNYWDYAVTPPPLTSVKAVPKRTMHRISAGADEVWSLNMSTTLAGNTVFPLIIHRSGSSTDYIMYVNWDAQGLKQYGEAAEDYYNNYSGLYYQYHYIPAYLLLPSSAFSGKSWTSEFEVFDASESDLGARNYSSRIVDTDASVTVPAGTFQHAVIVDQTDNTPVAAFKGTTRDGSGTRLRLWYVRTVGVVKIEQYTAGSNTPSETRELVSYGND